MRYQVLSELEHDHKVYLPESKAEPHTNLTRPGKHATDRVSPASIPVDRSGSVELSDADAGPLLASHTIAPLKQRENAAAPIKAKRTKEE
jgi:hypothetical protein